MKSPLNLLAFDLGASNGRAILGRFDGERITMQELHRYENDYIPLNGVLYWDSMNIFHQMKLGLHAFKRGGFGDLDCFGVDTWGVDFGLLDRNGQLLGNPWSYRYAVDADMQPVFDRIPFEELFRRTGVAPYSYNTLFQLYKRKLEGDTALENADTLLMTPDLLGYFFTGEKRTEYTIASTSQILNPRTKKFETCLLEKMGVKANLFGDIVMPGYVIGTLTDALAAETGLGKLPVVAVAGHDTASAVAAVPAKNEKFAYLSSGTWSLMGIEVKDPIITEETSRLNITNEGGVEGTTRLLKNITGMWLLEQCIKEWRKEAIEYTYPEIVKMARDAAPFQSFIDPDDESFANPPSMIKAIKDFCLRTGQKVPRNHSELIRCIFESLALKYKNVLDKFRSLAPFPIERLHIIGGGAKNRLLNQFTANATGVTVVAGPSEGTAIGNIMLQARAAGCVNSLQEMRDMIGEAIEIETFTPEDTDAWNAAYERIKSLIK